MTYKSLLASIIGTVTLASGSCTYATVLPGAAPELFSVSVMGWVLAASMGIYIIIKAHSEP